MLAGENGAAAARRSRGCSTASAAVAGGAPGAKHLKIKTARHAIAAVPATGWLLAAVGHAKRQSYRLSTMQ